MGFAENPAIAANNQKARCAAQLALIAIAIVILDGVLVLLEMMGLVPRLGGNGLIFKLAVVGYFVFTLCLRGASDDPTTTIGTAIGIRWKIWCRTYFFIDMLVLGSSVVLVIMGLLVSDGLDGGAIGILWIFRIRPVLALAKGQITPLDPSNPDEVPPGAPTPVQAEEAPPVTAVVVQANVVGTSTQEVTTAQATVLQATVVEAQIVDNKRT